MNEPHRGLLGFATPLRRRLSPRAFGVFAFAGAAVLSAALAGACGGSSETSATTQGAGGEGAGTTASTHHAGSSTGPSAGTENPMTGPATGTGGSDSTSTSSSMGGANPVTTTATGGSNPVTTTAGTGGANPATTTAAGTGGAVVGGGGGPVEDGCPIFPADNPWNTKVTGLSVDPNSDAYIAAIGAGTHPHADFDTDPADGIPWNAVDSSVQKVNVTFDDPEESDPGPYPIPANPLIEGNGAGGDRHLLLLDTTECKLYELGSAVNQNGTWHAFSGAIWDLHSNALRHECWTSADAAGLPIYPGLVRYEEVAAGVIKHAIRFTVNKSLNGWIEPARHEAGNPDPNSTTKYPPMGLRVRLKDGHIPANIGPQSLVIMTAMHDYGMFVADNGSSWYFQGTQSDNWDEDPLHNDFNQLTGNDFEVVNTGPIEMESPALCN